MNISIIKNISKTIIDATIPKSNIQPYCKIMSYFNRNYYFHL